MKLTTWERIVLDSIIGRQEGNVDTIYKASKVLDAVRLTEEEAESVKLRQEGASLRWDDADKEWEVEIPEGKLLDYLRQVVRAHTGWPVSSAKQVLSLMEKLGIEIKEE